MATKEQMKRSFKLFTSPSRLFSTKYTDLKFVLPLIYNYLRALRKLKRVSKMLILFCDIIILVLVFFIYLLIKKYENSRYLKNLQGPKPNFFLGNGDQFLFKTKEQLLELMMDNFKIHGRLIKIYIGPVKLGIVTADATFNELLLSSTKIIDKSQYYGFLHAWLGTGLLTSTEEPLDFSSEASDFIVTEEINSFVKQKSCFLTVAGTIENNLTTKKMVMYQIHRNTASKLKGLKNSLKKNKEQLKTLKNMCDIKTFECIEENLNNVTN